MKREKFIPKTVIDEDVPAFMGALAQAAKDGKKEFEFGGKTYKVKLKKDVVDKITKNMKESEDIDDIISALTEATASDYAKLSDDDLLDLLSIFKGVGRSAAKPVVAAIKREMQKRSLKEEAELEEANNRLVAHTPAAAQRLIKKLKNKFSGYKWDDMVKGNEIIYPNEPHIKRFIKKQPEVADMKESADAAWYHDNKAKLMGEATDLEEATKWWTVTITKKAGKLFKGQTVDVKASNSAEAIKKGLKQMKADPMTVPSGSVDAVLGESIEEAARMKYDKVIKKLKDGEWDTSMDVKKRMHLTYTDNKTGRKKAVFVESDELEEAKKVIAQVELWNGKKMKKSFKNQSAAENFIKKMQDQEDVRGYNMYAEELEEAKAPFTTLEKDWLRIKGIDTPRANKTRERLIKKYNLKPLISSVRPGSIKLGPLNDLKAKMGNHTIAGLDADGELIFVTNNPVKIYYPSNTKKRPEGEEIMSESVSLETLRLRKVVELSLGESIENMDSFIAEANIELTMTPSSIQKAYKKYVIERKGVPTYEIYHKTYSDAMQSAKSFAKGSGYEVDEDDWFNQVSSGPRKPSKDKTNRFSILLTKNGKEQKKRLQIQVTNLGTSGRPFELNAYIA